MITVITPTTPGREHLLAEMHWSLVSNTVRPARMLYAVDEHGLGPARMRNGLARNVDTEWLFPFDDDDLLDPHHFQTLLPHLTDEWDIVHTWCRIQHGGADHPEDQFQLEAKCDADWAELRERNWIPNAAAIRSDFFAELGGYRDVDNEDHDLWVRALDMGGRFHCVPVVTWTYRLDTAWEHRSHAGASRSAGRGLLSRGCS